MYVADPAAARFDPKRFQKQERDNTSGEEGVAPRNQKGQDHAVNSTPGSPHCGGCPSVAGESLHSDAVIHQVHSERRRGNRRGFVAAQRFWTISLPFAYPRWEGLNDCERLLMGTREFRIET